MVKIKSWVQKCERKVKSISEKMEEKNKDTGRQREERTEGWLQKAKHWPVSFPGRQTVEETCQRENTAQFPRDEGRVSRLAGSRVPRVRRGGWADAERLQRYREPGDLQGKRAEVTTGFFVLPVELEDSGTLEKILEGLWARDCHFVF